MPTEVRTFDDLSSTLARYPTRAHHPACKFHHHHIINLGGKEYCLGCLCMNTGLTLSLPIIIPFHLAGVNHWSIMLLGFLLYFPTLAQIKVQWKPFKMLSRPALGLGSGLFLLSALLLSPLDQTGVLTRIGALLFFMAVANISLRLRARYSRSPCDSCPAGRFPYCTYKLAEMERTLASGELEEEPREFLQATVAQLKGGATQSVTFTNIGDPRP